jgi:DNA-binding MarR family transcriptional regulator
MPLEDLTTYLLSLSGREARRRMAAQLSLPEFALLAALPASQRELGEHLRKDPADIVRLVDAASAAGLAVRTADLADRRRRVVSLTDAGAAALRSHLAAARDVEADFLASLSEDERRVLHALLSRLPR